MWIKMLIGLGLVAIALGVVITLNRRAFDKENAALVEELLDRVNISSAETFTRDDLDALPAPVQRYFDTVLEEGQPYVKMVRLEQRGEFRLGDRTAPWKPFTATQHFAVQPPGFVWEARIQIVPLVPVRVVDSYVSGEGALRAKVASALTVADQAASPELNAGELARYLAEAVWFPTALLPGQGVTWTPIDDQSAKATLEHGETSVSLVFHFNERNEVQRIYTEDRFREVEGDFEPTPWTGRFWNYQRRNGMRIPLDGEVAWNLPEGDLAYWRGNIQAIAHETAR
jgi:hypothetical protein